MKTIFISLFIYYVLVIIFLMTGEIYRYKKDLFIDLIPFGAIIRLFVNAFNKLH